MASDSGLEFGVFWKAAESDARPIAHARAALDDGGRHPPPSETNRAVLGKRGTMRLQELGHCIAVAKSIATSLHLGGDDVDRQRIQRLKLQLLSLTQAYAEEAYGSAELEKVRLINARELLLGVCRGCRKRADPRRVMISVTSVLGVAAVQPVAFAKAISELVDNAVEASRGGQLVSVSVFNTSDGDLLWQVRDDGAGMSARMLSDLADPHRSSRHGGVGLGITVARIIVEEHRGLLHLESSPGIGTTATVWLPRRTTGPRT